MTWFQKIKNIIFALLMIISAIIIVCCPAYISYQIVIFILGCSLLINGLGNILYYISMARFMVGGRNLLYRGVIMVDIGIVSLSISDVPRIYIILYMSGCYFFSAVIRIYQSLEERKLGASWKLNYSYGVINMVVAVLCIHFRYSTNLLADIYAVSLLYSACIRILNSFRETAIVYIP